MIELTAELEQAYTAATGEPNWTLPPRHREGLAAVLAIVEQDRCLERKGHVWHPLAKPRKKKTCDSVGPNGLLCERKPHPAGRHGNSSNGVELVIW